MRFDFFLPNLAIIIECQGAQHDKPVKWSKNWTKTKTLKNFREQCARDQDKYNLCMKKDIQLLYVRNRTDLEYIYRHYINPIRQGNFSIPNFFLEKFFENSLFPQTPHPLPEKPVSKKSRAGEPSPVGHGTRPNFSKPKIFPENFLEKGD